MPAMLISMKERLGRSRCQCVLFIIVSLIVVDAAVAAPSMEVGDLQLRPDRSSRPSPGQGKYQEQPQDPEQEPVLLQNYAHQCTPPSK
jgi:hypothetical protein